MIKNSLLLIIILSFSTISSAQQHAQKKKNPPKRDATFKPFLVCNLTDDQLHNREEKLRETIFPKVAKTIEHEDRYELIFNQPVDFGLELANFINLERKCCPGFTYTLRFDPEEGPIHLEIGNSKEIKEMLKTFFEK